MLLGGVLYTVGTFFLMFDVEFDCGAIVICFKFEYRQWFERWPPTGQKYGHLSLLHRRRQSSNVGPKGGQVHVVTSCSPTWVRENLLLINFPGLVSQRS